MEANQAEMKTKMEERTAKWSALNDSQKEELYVLQENEIDVNIQLIDKQLELGLIDSEMATEM